MKVGEERSQIDKKQGNIKTDGKVIGKAGLGKTKQLTKNKANEKADYEVYTMIITIYLTKESLFFETLRVLT